MKAIEAPRVLVDPDRTPDLDALLELLTTTDHHYDYSVAWIDCVAKGRRMGRSVLTRGRFARRGAPPQRAPAPPRRRAAGAAGGRRTGRPAPPRGRSARRDELPQRVQADPLRYRGDVRLSLPPVIPGGLLHPPPGSALRGLRYRPAGLPRRGRAAPLRYRGDVRLSMPPVIPGGLLNTLTVSAFNELWYRTSPKRKRDQLQTIPTFFHPLDGVGGGTGGDGPGGFVQYQFLVPFGQEDALRTALERIAGSGAASFLAVLKRFGEGDPGFLSFPAPGWTLALDIPVGRHLARLLDDLDELVAGAGGRIYLAKDARVRPEVFAGMYPELDRFRAVRARVDPDGVFTSDLARRLDL